MDKREKKLCVISVEVVVEWLVVVILVDKPSALHYRPTGPALQLKEKKNNYVENDITLNHPENINKNIQLAHRKDARV